MINKICIAPNKTSISAKGLKAKIDVWCDAVFAKQCCCFLKIFLHTGMLE